MSRLQASALILVDVQDGFEDPSWGRRNNAECDHNIGALLAAFRRAGKPVVYVRHDSVQKDSPLHPAAAGNKLKSFLSHDPDLLVRKSVNSAFYGTPDLHAWLQQQQITTLVITGYTTNHCCETTARMAGNLGYDVEFVLDATQAFDRLTPFGKPMSAEVLAEATGASLHGEFANVTSTSAMLQRMEHEATVRRPVDRGDILSRQNADHYVWGQACDGWHLVATEPLSVIEERMPPHARENPHRHAVAEQFFYVLSGEAILVVEGKRHSLHQHEGVHVPARSIHWVVNESKEDLRFLLVSCPSTRGDREELSAAIAGALT